MVLSAPDPREYINDQSETLRAVRDSGQGQMWTAMPAKVTSVNLPLMTLEAVPTIMGRFTDPSGTLNFVEMPPCVDVPICFPSCAGFSITYPITTGDEVLLVFASRCIDSWWQSGGTMNRPMEFRMHDLSDGFAIPGPRSQPNVVTGISSTDLQIRNALGTTFVSIGADGRIGFTGPAVSLNKVLTDFNTAVSTFMAVLAAFGGGGAPVTQAMLEAPATAAVTALTLVQAEIGALLK